MDKETIIRYKPDIDTLMQVSKYLVVRLYRLKYAPLFLLALVLINVIPQLINKGMDADQLSWTDILVPTLLVPAVWVFIYYSTMSRMRKNIANNKRNFELQKITFNTNSYIQEGETFKVESFWNETYEITETDKWFLIYPRKNSAFPIVKSEISADEQQRLRVLFNALPVRKKLL